MVKQVITRSSVSPRIDENVEEHLENHLDKHIKTTYLIMKRILDIIFSLLALVLLCPVFFLDYLLYKNRFKGVCFF
jgi:O-antigen biosynthesis protein WbqP